jgi:hypothetical protein
MRSLAGHYDGKTLARFCDGQRKAGKAWSGKLANNRGPLLIGAETNGGQLLRYFRGEPEVAALWSRALTDDELFALSQR